MNLQSINVGRSIVAFIVIVGFFAVIAILLLKPVPVTGDIAEILKVLLGGLGAKFGDVVAFHIGSSAGSKEKDDIMRIAMGNGSPQAPN